MDYLDPEKMRKQKIRLFVGYSLLAIVIGFGTLLLMMVASGYVIDSKTGSVVRYGAVLVNSNPEGAKIILDGKDVDQKTNSKLNIPANTHTVKLQLSGYRDFERKFDLEPSSVFSLTYARMFLENQKVTQNKILEVSNMTATASNENKAISAWCLDVSPNIIYYKLKESDKINTLSVPANLLTGFTKSCDKIEFANENELMIRYSEAGNKVFIGTVVDKPNYYSINAKIGLNGKYDFSWFDKKADSVAVYNPDDKSLVAYKIDNKNIVLKPIANIVNYNTNVSGQVVAISQDAANTFKLLAINKDSTTFVRAMTSASYLLDVADKGGDMVLIVGSSEQQKTLIFRAPDKYDKDKPEDEVPPVRVMRTPGLIELGYSIGIKNIFAHTNSGLVIYNFDEGAIFESDLIDQDVTKPISWLDGYYYTYYSTKDGLNIVDFTDNNKYTVGLKYKQQILTKIDTINKQEQLEVVSSSDVDGTISLSKLTLQQKN